jgi:hypothetical protein
MANTENEFDVNHEYRNVEHADPPPAAAWIVFILRPGVPERIFECRGSSLPSGHRIPN